MQRCMRRCLPAAYPAKAVPPFGSSNNKLHSCRLSIAEKCGANNRQEQSNASLTVWYEIHTSHSQPRIEQLICRTNHVAQQFSCLSLDNGTERWRKVVLDNLWRSHINRHWLASIWSVGSRRLSPKATVLWFGNKLIFVNYIDMNEK
jgi:hypothetical protein